MLRVVTAVSSVAMMMCSPSQAYDSGTKCGDPSEEAVAAQRSAWRAFSFARASALRVWRDLGASTKRGCHRCQALLVARLREVQIHAASIERFTGLIGEERAQRFLEVAEAARSGLAGRTIWNVSSTAAGGGVAEMLQVLLSYARAAGVDARWLVIDGAADFFTLTKRLHNLLHGVPGDGGSLDASERAAYDRVSEDNAGALCRLVRAGDVVLLHDPQTAGLVEAVRSVGATVIWRCHIGADAVNGHVEAASSFLRPYLELADAFVFSRRAHVHTWIPEPRVTIIPPSIDPLAPKNQDLDGAVVRAILGRIGFLADDGGMAVFHRRDGSPCSVSRRAEFPRRGEEPPAGAPLIVQVSRWDRLKDMTGVLTGFAEAVPPPAHLALVGPSAESVADDPEEARVLDECVAGFDDLPSEVQTRVHLVSLPMEDNDENAAMVNAFQRYAAIVAQKSLQEGFGLTVTEAMIKGRPIVASRVGGIQDQIRHEREGLLIDDPADLDEFGRALNSLLADPRRAASLGEAARARAIDQFVGDRHLIQYADLLTRLLAGPRRPFSTH